MILICFINFILRKEISGTSIPISLVHHEYPTNFRYKNVKLKEVDGYGENEMHLTNINHTENHGVRGNFDLVILNKQFIDSLSDS